MSNAIRIYETGGPDVLRWESYEPGQPGKPWCGTRPWG
jgi:hypothetical protein